MPVEHVPVVVVGAGPTGVAAANLLGHYGVPSVVLERRAEVYPLPRAVHFDDEVFRIFAHVGLADDVRAISRPCLGMRLTDAQHRVLAQFDRNPQRQVNGFPQANMFDQPNLEQVLRDGLARFDCVELRTGVDVAAVEQVGGGPGPVRVRYRTAGTDEPQELWADVVLAADGANSATRAALGAQWEDLHFEQQWLVIDVDSPEAIGDYDGVQQVCDDDRAATFMPVVPGRYRWEFRLCEGDDPAEFDEARVLDLIRPWLTGVDVERVRVVRRSVYTFRGVVADRWRAGRVVLLGDACHLTPPFIGQGLGAGIRDAYNVAWKVARVVTGTADDRILATYEQERRPYTRRVVRLAIGIGATMTGGSRRTGPARRAALRAITRLPGVESRVVESTWPAFTAGLLVERSGRHSVAGELCPAPRVRVAALLTRLDAVLGDGFAIVYRGPDVTTRYEPALLRWYADAGVRLLRFGSDLDDVDGVLGDLLDRSRAGALLVRPDRIIAATAPSAELRRWRDLLRRAGLSVAGAAVRRQRS